MVRAIASWQMSVEFGIKQKEDEICSFATMMIVLDVGAKNIR